MRIYKECPRMYDWCANRMYRYYDPNDDFYWSDIRMREACNLWYSMMENAGHKP